MKKYISILLITILLIFSFNIQTYALQPSNIVVGIPEAETNPSGSLVDTMFTWKFQDSLNHANDKHITLDQYMAEQGFITNKDNYTTAKNWVKSIIANNPNAFGGKTADQVTNADLDQWVKNNITVTNYGNGNINFTTSGDFNQNVNSIENSIKQDSGFFYAYAFKLNMTFDKFPDGTLYNAFRQFINYVHETYQSDDYICILFNWSNSYDAYYLKKDSTVNMVINNIYQDYYTVSFVNNSAGNYMAPSEEYFGRYHYSGGTFVKENLTYPYNIRDNFRDVVRFAVSANQAGYTGHDQPSVFAFETTQLFPIYKGGLQVQNKQGVADNGYFVKDSFNPVTGSYNTSTNDIDNSISYGDIELYIDKHTEETGNPPTENDINIYINNYIPETPTPTPTPTTTPTPTPNPGGNTGGGGSVSSNTNNGGSASASATANNSGVNVTVNNNHSINLNVPGLSSNTVSGNGNGSGGIFDWISDIGGVIGDFIKNVGQLIADVIKGITETITTVLADIPNIISVLVEFVYGGLPDELKAIVTLGITTVIFVGVIKMMRK